MRYLSVCSGIEAATVAWHGLGWQPFAFAEVDPFPCAVLAHHYPNTPNLGDMTQFQEWPDAAIDVLVGGTPCQSFSVAGLRKGLDDPRGNLMLTFGAIAQRYRPQWLVWENVPGVLSSNGGRDFGTFLGMLGELGYGFAYRVFDAQYFGVAQRRRRVFVVGCLGDWRRAAAVLFERHSLQGHPAPRREAREGIASSIVPRVAGSLDTECGGGKLTHQTAANGHLIAVAHTLRAEGFDASEDGTGRGTPLVPVLVPVGQPYTLAIRGRGDSHNLEYRQDGTANALVTPNGGRGGINVGAVAFHTTQITSPQNGSTLRAASHGALPMVSTAMRVRRLTPRECERLQGFGDDYTQIPYRNKPADQCPDGPRYKALGNSMAVPVMRWIGERIQMVKSLSA